MDFFSILPLEVVEKILIYLNLEDLLQCCLVCKNWYTTLVNPGLERLWIRTCHLTLGLSSIKLLEYHARLSFPVLAAVALKHRKWVKGLTSQVDAIGTTKIGSDYNVRSFLGSQRMLRHYPQCNLSIPTCFLGYNFTLCEFSSPKWGNRLTLTSVNTIDKTLSSSSLAHPIHHSHLIYWAKASQDYVLMLVQPTGQWIGYCSLTDKVILDTGQAKVESLQYLLSHGCISVACCEKCFMVVCATAQNEESVIWKLTSVNFSKPRAEGSTPETLDMRTVLVKLLKDEKVVHWDLVSQSPRTPHTTYDCGCCVSHSLICVSNTKITVYQLSLVASSSATVSGMANTPAVEMSMQGFANIAKSNNHNTESHPIIQRVCVSADGRVIGVIVSPFQFYVLDVENHCTLISSLDLSEIHGLGEAATNARLIAVGHIYSVVGTFDSKPGGQVSIVSTHSGVVLCQRRSRVQWCVMNNQDYIHLINEDWLNDIYCYNAPLFIYVNKSALRQHSSNDLSYIQFS